MSALPQGKPAGRPPSVGLDPAALGHRIDQFLASRGIAGATGSDPRTGVTHAAQVKSVGSDPGTVRGSDPGTSRPAEFVCEEDVRQALRTGAKIVLDSRTIVTSAARDLGDEKHVFIDAR